jgi:hypothetical protein
MKMGKVSKKSSSNTKKKQSLALKKTAGNVGSPVVDWR